MVRMIENYTLYEVVGEGAYGKVYRAVNKLDNKEYAVKVIQVKKFQTNKKLQECTVHEINILTNIQKNNHIITYFDMLKTQNNFYFVYQFCNGGTLQNMLRKQNTLDERQALLIFKQLLQAFQVLNKYNIMHRDLKPDNIFFNNGVIKVGDFGFCKSLEKAEMTKTMLGSPIYMAPQILNGQIYSNKADIWSIGVVLYEMLYGYCPFESSSIPKLIQVLKQTELEFPNQIIVSNQTKKLLKRILTKDPQKRIQWMQLFQIKITSQGKLLQGGTGRLSLVDEERGLARTVREISETQQASSPTTGTNSPLSSITNSISTPSHPNVRPYTPTMGGNFNNFISPRNAAQMQQPQQQNHHGDSLNNKTQPDERIKGGLMKKPQGTVDQGETVANSPLRKMKSMEGNPIINNNNNNNSIGGSNKEKVLKFHQEIVRGMNIVRSMGLNNQKYTPLFTYFALRVISERMKKFREQQLPLTSPQADVKQYRQILDGEIDDLDYQVAMMRNKVQDFPDWKKAIKAKSLQIKNTRLCYELVMFLSGETHSETASINQMKCTIKAKTN